MEPFDSTTPLHTNVARLVSEIYQQILRQFNVDLQLDELPHTLTDIKELILRGIRKSLGVMADPRDVEAFKKDLRNRLESEKARCEVLGERKKTVSLAILNSIDNWFEDEIILTTTKAQIDKLSTLNENITTYSIKIGEEGLHLLHNGRQEKQITFGIEFKSEYYKASKNNTSWDNLSPEVPISIVVQGIFVICHKDGAFLALHNRSFSGAEDRKSKYSLNTGRVALDDFMQDYSMGNGIPIDTLLREHALKRELQEIDELGLSDSLAQVITGKEIYLDTRETEVAVSEKMERTKFIGLFKDRKGKVFSFLYAIFITIEEFNKLTRRGPYLVPVTPLEFSRLKSLNLVNDILHTNTCEHCIHEEIYCFYDTKTKKKKKNLRNCTNCKKRDECFWKSKKITCTNCLIRKVVGSLSYNKLRELESWTPDSSKDENIELLRTKLHRNSIIMVIDIPNYPRLTQHKIHQVREQLERLIFSFLPTRKGRDHYLSYALQITPKGYFIVLQEKKEGAQEELTPALYAYFFSLFLSMKLAKYNYYEKELVNANGKQKSTPGDGVNYFPPIRIGLHYADLSSNESLQGFEYFPGNGINQTFHIMEVGRSRQMLCSQDYAVRLLTELEYLNQDYKAEIGNEGNLSALRKKTNLKVNNSAKLWSPEELYDVLFKDLRIPPLAAMDIMQDETIVSCFAKYGLPIIDLGIFTENHGPRYRLFNLGILRDEGDQSNYRYGNISPPQYNIPFVQRNGNIAKTELDNTIDELVNAQYITIHGYSNIRTMQEIYERYIIRGPGLEKLEDIKIIFQDYYHYTHINEDKPLIITQAKWILGFLYANKIGLLLSKQGISVKIAINSQHSNFNVLKVMYHSDAPATKKDYLRVTVPMPGGGFEISPVFIVNRGDPLYHSFLDICEKFIEQGQQVNGQAITVREYQANSKNKIFKEIFDSEPPPPYSSPNNFADTLTPDRKNEFSDLLRDSFPKLVLNQREIDQISEILKSENADNLVRLWWSMKKAYDFRFSSEPGNQSNGITNSYQAFLKEFEKQ